MQEKLTLTNRFRQGQGAAARPQQNYDSVASYIRVRRMDLTSDYKPRLKDLLQRKSIVWGKVKLSSGQESDYYFDCKPTTLDPEGAFLTAHAVLDLLEEKRIRADAIGGPPIGAHPIVAAVATVSYLRSKEGKGRPLPAFLIRKQPKAHGLEKQIEGIDIKKVRDVVIIDDVCTKGESTLEALKIVEEAGLRVAAVLSIIDREAGGSEKLRQKYPYFALFTGRELLEKQSSKAAESR
jgi:orotate phosphoribosyltransferase